METSSLIQFWKKLKNLLLFRVKNSSVESSENLARYLTSSGWFASTKSRVKYKAFMPAPNGQLSVFSIGSKKEGDVKEVALKHVHPKMTHVSIYGYASCLAQEFEKAKLKLINSEPPPNHINVENWPDSKDEQMFLAQEIAENSRLKIFPNKIDRVI